jgi:hypothetical protein
MAARAVMAAVAFSGRAGIAAFIVRIAQKQSVKLTWWVRIFILLFSLIRLG